jgi:hypothetical protein
MSQTITQIDPVSTDGVLKYMRLAIDEIKLLRSIDSLTEQVRLSHSLEFDPGRKRYLLSELRFLNKRLESLRERVNLH